MPFTVYIEPSLGTILYTQDTHSSAQRGPAETNRIGADGRDSRSRSDQERRCRLEDQLDEVPGPAAVWRDSLDERDGFVLDSDEQSALFPDLSLKGLDEGLSRLHGPAGKEPMVLRPAP